jgi:hypothetical protein
MTAAQGPGLLVVRSRVPGSMLPEYHAWYDNEHVPARIRLPGWLTARRYVAAADPGDPGNEGDAKSFLACYDLENLGVLRQQPYIAMREQRSAAEQRILGLIPPMDRRVYRRTDPPDSSAHQLGTCGALLLCVWWQPAPGTEAAFHDWYRQEHIPMLSQVPGWLRSRRFELTDGDGPAFLAMHDLASADVFDHPDYPLASSTPWRAAMAASRIGYERVLYRLLRRFD